MNKARALLAFLSVPLFLLLRTGVAEAAPTIYQNSVYVGAEWTVGGSYDDSIPEEDPADNQGVVDADSTNYADGDVFTSFVLQGSMPSTATIIVTFYPYGGGTPGNETTGSPLGTITLTAADLGHVISVPTGYSSAWGMSFQTEDVANTTGGYWYLQRTYSTDTDVSSSGEVDYAMPPWLQGGTTGLTPPDWSQIEQGIANDIWQQVPPVQAPPSGSDSIDSSAVPTITSDPMLPPQSLDTPTVSAPSMPPEMGDSTYDFTSYTPIPIPTSDSQQFSIEDPIGNLPHGGDGDAPTFGTSGPYSMSGPGLTYANPTTGSSGPAFSGPVVPSGGLPGYNGGPSASESTGGTSVSGPSPSGNNAGSTGSSGPSPTVGSQGNVTGPSPGGVDTSNSTGPSPGGGSVGASGGNNPYYDFGFLGG